MASLLGEGEAWNAPDTLRWRLKRCRDAPRGWGRNVGTVRRGKRGDLLAEVTAAGVRVLMVPRSPLGTAGRCGGNAEQNAGRGA